MADTQSEGQKLINAERARQIMYEGYTEAHDDDHDAGELEYAAAAYQCAMDANAAEPNYFPFSSEHWKPKDRKKNLIRAGALYLAEIDRLRRMGKAVATVQAIKRCSDNMNACAILIDGL